MAPAKLSFLWTVKYARNSSGEQQSENNTTQMCSDMHVVVFVYYCSRGESRLTEIAVV